MLATSCRAAGRDAGLGAALPELRLCLLRAARAAAVRCVRAIRLGDPTRCQVRYANGDTQLILVGLDGRGDLDITIPYPAQRRPGD